MADDSYLVYDAVIRAIYPGNKLTVTMGETEVKRLVIRDETITEYAWSKDAERWDRVKMRLSSLDQELISNFEGSLKKSTKFQRSFVTDLPYTLMSATEIDRLFYTAAWDERAKNWDTFHKEHPGVIGYNAFSNVGLNATRDKALVYFVHWCGGSCGTGHYLVLKKTDGKWRVEQRAEMWIS